MLKSMTGFGRGENSNKDYSFNIEIKTVNHRYNDIVVRIPRHISFLENSIKSVVKKRIKRGRVEIYIDFEYLNDSYMDVKIEMPLAKAFKRELEKMMVELNIKDEINLSHILMFPDIIKKEQQDYDEDAIWQCLEPALTLALNNVISMREKEGLALKKDMENHIFKVKENLSIIEEKAPLVPKEYKIKLKSRINELLDDEMDIDEDRLNTEVAFYADKSDINEEIVRLKSHSEQFLDTLNQNSPVGRKLDFILQEMHREINTIGSKTEDLTISNCVIDIKSSLEKIREQVQNVE